MRLAIFAATVGGLTAIIVFTVGYALENSKFDLAAFRNSGLIEIITVVISVVSLFIAVNAYQDAKKSGDEQQKILDASRIALESVVSVVKDEQQILQKTQKTLEENLKTQTEYLADVQKAQAEHLALVQKTREEEQLRLAMKPIVEIGLDQWDPPQLKEILEKHGRIQAIANSENKIHINFRVGNEGEVQVIQPVVVVDSDPKSVQLSGPGTSTTGKHPHSVQFIGPSVLDIPPRKVSGKYHRFGIEATVPPEVNEIVLNFSIHGLNLNATSIKVPILVLRKNSELKNALP